MAQYIICLGLASIECLEIEIINIINFMNVLPTCTDFANTLASKLYNLTNVRHSKHPVRYQTVHIIESDSLHYGTTAVIRTQVCRNFSFTWYVYTTCL